MMAFATEESVCFGNYYPAISTLQKWNAVTFHVNPVTFVIIASSHLVRTMSANGNCKQRSRSQVAI